jgi:integrase
VPKTEEEMNDCVYCGVSLEVGPGTVTLSEFVRAEWKPNAALALRKSSMRIYSYQLEKHILPAFGELSVRDIGVAHIEACLSKLKQKGHATSTLRSVRATFATVLRSAVKRGYLEKNHAHGVCIREVDSKKERRFYSPEQTRMLLGALTEPCASVVSIAVLTGMRIGEILGLRWKRVDLLGANLTVAENYSSGEFGSPKTKSSRRVIPISSALRRVLEALRARIRRIPRIWCSRPPRAPRSATKTCTTGSLLPRAIGSGSRESRGTRSGTLMRRFCMKMASL